MEAQGVVVVKIVKKIMFNINNLKTTIKAND
jgi:hypothetical protein